MSPLTPPPVLVPEGLSQDLAAFAPAFVIFGAALIILLWEAVVRPADKRVFMGFSLTAILVALGLNVGVAVEDRLGFSGMVSFDAYSVFFNSVFLISAALSTLLSHDYLERVGVRIGEYYSLVLFGLFGMMLLGMGADLMLLFVGIEVMSIAFYCLSAIKRTDARGIESGFKYFIMGAFASGILLYGVSFVYGATGTTSLQGIRAAIEGGVHGGMLGLGVAFIIAGFLFKIAAVPFHMWAPDVYEGAPASVTGYMATGVKAASFAAFGRVLFVAFLGLKDDWAAPLMVIAAVTMLLGNLVALVQDDLKRMLAYSSIAHAGYMLMALVAVDSESVGLNGQVSGLLFYLLAYTFMNLGAFAVLTLMAGDRDDLTSIKGLAGLSTRNPAVAAGLALCLFSLAGIPPTMGFVGKFYLFAAAVRADYVGLAVIAALSGAIGVYYYLRPIVVMYMQEGGEPLALRPTAASVGALAIASVAILYFGLFPSQLIELCQAGVLSLVG